MPNEAPEAPPAAPAPKKRRKPGTPAGLPQSAARRRASRVNGWKHGLAATKVDIVEVKTFEMKRKRPKEFAKVRRDIAAAISGQYAAVEPMQARALAETEMVRRALVEDIEANGVVVVQQTALGESIRDNPSLLHLHKINDTLGYTARDVLLSKKSRGESARDTAIASSIMRRNELLRRADKTLLPPPPALPPAPDDEDEPIDTPEIETS